MTRVYHLNVKLSVYIIMQPIILYKIHGMPDCDKLQIITRYLHSKGVDLRPKTIVERSFPSNINILPTIVLQNGLVIEGLNDIRFL